MIVADLAGVTRAHGDRTIFAGLSWAVAESARIGLIGANGTGKSTLLRTIAGVEPPDAGTVARARGVRVAYLEQEQAPRADRTVLEELLGARPDIAAIEAALGTIARRLADPTSSADLTVLEGILAEQEVQLHRFEQAGGPRLRNRAEGLLRDLGLPRAQWDRPQATLSGGERKLVGLAGCLITDPDLLLLDEPDNHLDLRHKQVLEDVLRRFAGALIIVSHDRYLLDDTVDQIAELEPAASRSAGARLRIWEGNYSAYVTQKEIALRRQQQDYASQQKEIARLEEAVKRFELWARLVVDERHIKQARNKQRQIDRMEKVERPVLERRRMALTFKPRLRGGAIAVDLRAVSLALDEREILHEVAATVQNGERIGIVGSNGAGKTVLLALIHGERTPDTGSVWVGPSIELGRYAQHHETLDPRWTAVEAIRDARPMTEGEAVAKLLKFLIPYAAAQNPIGTLSGGEKSRVQLARLMLSGANCLMLDEPTNNLDIASAEVLEASLDEFPGTVIVVSHDRYLLDDTVDQIAELEPAASRSAGARLRIWEGNYSAYVTQKEIALRRQQQDYASQQKEIARLEEAVKRFELWARLVVDERHIKQARNKQRQIDRMEKVERPVLERRRMALTFKPRLRGGAIAVDLRAVSLALDGREILHEVAATVQNGERIGIVGSNGAGKTVLLALIHGERTPDTGSVWVGPSIELGRYAQHHETLDPRWTAVEAIRDARPMTEGEAVAKLLKFLIPYAAAQNPVGTLSGGEKSRVQLARLMLSGANCLLLDEPTNNLDIASAEVLEASLDEFPGTVIVVSHDRYFLDRIVDRIFAIEDGRLRVFEGGYSAYAAARAAG